MKLKPVTINDEKHEGENLAGVPGNYCPKAEFAGDDNPENRASFLVEKQRQMTVKKKDWNN